MTPETAHDARVRAILDWHRIADVETRRAGRRWYAEAGATAAMMAVAYDVPLRTAAGVIAALSPRTRWSVNVRWAHAVLQARSDGRDMPAVSTGANRRKAWAIAQGADYRELMGPRSPKTRAFAGAILGDEGAVVVDTWAARAAGEPSGEGLQGARYDAIADAYRDAGHQLRIRPAILQAIVWCAIRGRST